MKKETLKNILLKKKPVIAEAEAQFVVEKIHELFKGKDVIKTSVDLPASLFKAMKIRLIQERKTMQNYLESLIRLDMNKYYLFISGHKISNIE